MEENYPDQITEERRKITVSFSPGEALPDTLLERLAEKVWVLLEEELRLTRERAGAGYP